MTEAFVNKKVMFECTGCRMEFVKYVTQYTTITGKVVTTEKILHKCKPKVERKKGAYQKMLEKRDNRLTYQDE